MIHADTAIVFLLVGFLFGFCAALALTPRHQTPAPQEERDPADWWKDT